MSSRHNNQSIRSSCDRCRSQKLKCTISPEGSRPGTHQCVRCVRAQVTCVFGRRTQSRRTSDVKKADRKSTPNKTRDSELPQPRLQSTTPVDTSFLSGLFLGSPSVLEGTWSGSDDFGAREAEERLGLGVNTTNTVPISDSDVWNELGSDPGMSLSDLIPSSLPTDSHLPQSPLTYNYDTLVAPNIVIPVDDGKEGQSSFPELSDRESPHAIVQLSTLVAEIHETSKTLEGYPWSNEFSPNQLYNYPIGRVLSLSQEFISALKCVWLAKNTGSNDPTRPGSVNSGNESSSSPLQDSLQMSSYVDLLSSSQGLQKPFVSTDEITTSAAPSAASSVDTPTMLLVLSCYISLTNLYSLVFAHFESHLSQVPEAPPPHHSQAIRVTHGWGLQLGELPSADETCAKICTAVQMLLDSFQSVEDIVGLPRSLGAVGESKSSNEGVELDGDANNASPWTAFLAQSLLKQDANGACGDERQEVSRLPMKVQSLKALLRAKMNL